MTAQPQDMEDLFGPPISAYDDRQAVEDGILIPLDTRDRVTTNAFHAIARIAEDQKGAPSRWPVVMMPYFQAKTGETRAVPMAAGLVGDVRDTGRNRHRDDVYEVRYALIGPHGFRELTANEPAEGSGQWLTLLVLSNECGGLTLMLPEDN